MNKQALLILTIFAIMVSAIVPVAHGAFTVNVNSPVNSSNTTDTTPPFVFNVTGDNATYSHKIFVGSSNITERKEIANNTPVHFNLTTQTDGAKTVWIEVINASVLHNVSWRITIDTTAPTLTINQPTSTSDFTPLDTATLTVDLNITVSDATVGLDKCNYEIYNVDVNDAPSVFRANTTITSCQSQTSITPRSGNNRLSVWANDTLGNRQTATVGFKYRVQSVGGAGSAGGTGTITNQPVVQKQPISISGVSQGSKTTTQAKPQDNKFIVVVLIAIGIWYFFLRKKKR